MVFCVLYTYTSNSELGWLCDGVVRSGDPLLFAVIFPPQNRQISIISQL